MINSFFFNYSSRIRQEYFQAKIGREVRILSLAPKNNILNYKKRSVSAKIPSVFWPWYIQEFNMANVEYCIPLFTTLNKRDSGLFKHCTTCILGRIKTPDIIIKLWSDEELSIAIKLFQSSLQNAKTKDKVILKHQKCLSEPDHKFPPGPGPDIVCLVYIWVSDWSAKLVENNFDI